MNKQTIKRGQPPPPDIELTEYHKLDVIFTDKEQSHLFSFRLDRDDPRGPGCAVFFELYFGAERSSQMLLVENINAPLAKGAKKKHVEKVIIDLREPFNGHWHLTVNGLTWFTLQYDGDLDDTLAVFTVYDGHENPVSSFDIEQPPAIKAEMDERIERAMTAPREGVQDRREWENERFIELMDNLGSEPETRRLLMAILEAKAAPNDLDAQYSAISHHLAAVLKNDHCHAKLYNFTGDGIAEMGNALGMGVISDDCMTTGFVGILRRAKSAERGGTDET